MTTGTPLPPEPSDAALADGTVERVARRLESWLRPGLDARYVATAVLSVLAEYPMTVRVNLNSHARVRLTEAGRKVWHDAWAPYSRDGTGMDHKVTADGVLREQLWSIMQAFGPRLIESVPALFASVEIEIEEATAVPVNHESLLDPPNQRN